MFRVRKGIRYRRRKKIAVGIVLVTILLILLGGLIFRIAKRTIPEVILKVKNVSILQDEEIPQIQAAASCKDEKYSEKELEKGKVYNKFQPATNLLITNYPNCGGSEMRSWCHETVAKDWQKFRSTENYNKLAYHTEFPLDGRRKERRNFHELWNKE